MYRVVKFKFDPRIQPYEKMSLGTPADAEYAGFSSPWRNIVLGGAVTGGLMGANMLKYVDISDLDRKAVLALPHPDDVALLKDGATYDDLEAVANLFSDESARPATTAISDAAKSALSKGKSAFVKGLTPYFPGSKNKSVGERLAFYGGRYVRNRAWRFARRKWREYWNPPVSRKRSYKPMQSDDPRFAPTWSVPHTRFFSKRHRKRYRMPGFRTRRYSSRRFRRFNRFSRRAPVKLGYRGRSRRVYPRRSFVRRRF